MNTRQSTEESNILKEIQESLSSLIKRDSNLPKKNNSMQNITSKNLNIGPIEEDKSELEQEKEDSESNREYKIGNYLVKHTLGQGTFGKVKLGVYIPNNEKVAIKILEKNRIIEKDDEIRVKREFDMLAQFSHPNVILVAEIFESEDSYYSVMEFCEGGELFNYIVKKNRLSENESAFFFFQLINGLEYIHSLGIVHRDLKPENLLLTDEHILKIIDFGLSNYFKSGQTELLSTPCGSPCYASPEMVAGKKYDGFKIDVWSCGIILYAMLCGYLPFEDPDNEVLFKKILECKLEFPEYVNKLSIDLIEKILVTDPEKRITIKEIKKHPFYLKGKDIFEEGFSINNLVQNPIEKNMDNKNKENIDINVNNVNSVNNNNQEINNDENVIEIDLNKEGKHQEKNIKNKEKENMADIGYKNIDNNNKEKIKEERRNEINKDNLNTIDVNINNNSNNNNELIKNKKEKKTKKNNRKKNKQNKNNNVQKNKNNDNAVIINDKEDKEIERNEKKPNKLNIEINLDNNLNQNDEDEKKRNYKKNIIPTEQEEIYMPLKTEYNNLNVKFNTVDDIKDNKQNKEKQKDRIKKNKDIIKENNLKKYFELKPQEKSNTKDNSKTKEKSVPKSKEKSKSKEKKLIIDLINLPEKLPNKEEKKKSISPKKFFISKNVKSQRPSNIQNLSKKINLNLKFNPKKKYLQQKTRIEKLVSAKEPKRIKSTFEYKNINLNKNAKNTRSQIKGILNTFNLNKKLNDERLHTEIVHLKNKNFLDKNNYFNKTIDTMKNNILFNISDIKSDNIKNRVKKNNLNTKLFHELDDKLNLNDIKRIKSSTFNDENNNILNTINTHTLPIHTQTQTFLNKNIQPIKSKPNSNIIYGINNFSNLKVPYELNINDNNSNNNILNNNNSIRTEPSSELFIKLSNIPKKTSLYNNRTNFIKKTKTNTTASLGLNNHNSHNRNINSRKTNLQYRPYLKYINAIRKAPTYNFLKTMNLKIPKTTSEILHNKKIISKERKNPYLIINNNKKNNQQVTIRNTVINFNMIDTEIILPSFKKIKNGKKFNSTYNTNTAMRRQNKKNSREISNEIKTYNTLSNIDAFNNLNKINNIENKYNNTINRFSHLNNMNNYLTKDNKLSNNIYEYSNMNNSSKKINSISSFNKLVNNMKIKQKYNKMQFNNYNITNINNTNANINELKDKNHNKFRSMKFNDYFKANTINRKHLEISGINNINNNLSTNSINNTIINSSNRLRSINNEPNMTLPTLINNNKNKKFIIPKGKGYIITQQGKIGKMLTAFKTPSIYTENIK